MPTVKANGLTFHYEEQGSGPPLVLIPYLAADHACYPFQVDAYAQHFTCLSLDLRGTGESDDPDVAYSTEDLAEDVAGLIRVLRLERAHVAGLSLGAAVGQWLAVKHPELVASLSLHSAWTRTDPFLETVVHGWQTMAQAAGGVADAVILGIFPWCFTPELYAARPDFIRSLAAFVRSRPQQPVPAFLRQSNAVLAHDVEAHLGRVSAPTLITCGEHDQLTSLRFAEPMRQAVRGAELVVFEGCAHAALYEKMEDFNRQTLAFLRRQSA